MIALSPGQTLIINRRLWSLRQLRRLQGRCLELETVGASEASLGMPRLMKAVLYGPELFIERRQGGYWYAHLEHDWIAGQHGPALNCRAATELDLLATHTRYPANGSLRNEFSWSYSRSARYRLCPRAYYYYYYAAWEGWLKESPEPVKRAYLLKNLTDISRWTGILVHESIRFAMARLKAGQPVQDDDLIKSLQRRARTDFAGSERGDYVHKPNQVTGFQEHHYRLALPRTDWQTAMTAAERHLRTFLNSALYADLRSQPPTTLLDVEVLKSFTIGGTKIWVQMDLARRCGDEIVLYDWKTGAVDPDELRHQIGVYGLFVRQAWPQWASLPVRGVVFALTEDRLVEFDLNDAVLQATRATIEASLEQLQSLLVDRSSNLAEPQRFPMIDDLSICRRCQFRALCGRDK